MSLADTLSTKLNTVIEGIFSQYCKNQVFLRELYLKNFKSCNELLRAILLETEVIKQDAPEDLFNMNFIEFLTLITNNPSNNLQLEIIGVLVHLGQIGDHFTMNKLFETIRKYLVPVYHKLLDWNFIRSLEVPIDITASEIFEYHGMDWDYYHEYAQKIPWDYQILSRYQPPLLLVLQNIQFPWDFQALQTWYQGMDFQTLHAVKNLNQELRAAPPQTLLPFGGLEYQSVITDFQKQLISTKKD